MKNHVHLDQLSTPAWVYDVLNHKIVWANETALTIWEAKDKQSLYQRDLSIDITEVTDKHLHQLSHECLNHSSTMWWTLYPNNHPKELYLRFSHASGDSTKPLLLCEVAVTRREINRDTNFTTSNSITSLYSDTGKFLSGSINFSSSYNENTVDISEILEMSLEELNERMGSFRHFSLEQQVINNGRLCWYSFQIERLLPERDFLVIQEDITKRKTQEHTYKHLAYHDQLTGILNRYGLNDYLSENCQKDSGFFLFLLDLDAFKLINNNLGHQAGDQVLIEIARRLVRQLPQDYLVCRFGGDEFVVISPQRQDSQSQEAISELLLEIVSEPIVEVDSIQITASIGTATYPVDATTPDALIMYADTAMYKAKERGTKSYVRFVQQMSHDIQRKSAIQQALKQVLSLNELVPLYQPIVDIKNNTLIGMEALLSWDSSALGQKIPPDEFVEEAERSGMMNEIGQWILKRACSDCKQWQDITQSSLQLSVNVSPIQLNDNFITTLDQILLDTGFPANQLTLELTESIFLLNINQVIKRLEQIKQRGICICIDDFGTGYSSLSYIHKLPIHALKIDRSFVANIDDSIIVVEATIAMASKLGLKIVAEGIETQYQRELMMQYPNMLGQGFYFSRPVPAESFVNLPLFQKLMPPKDQQKIIQLNG